MASQMTGRTKFYTLLMDDFELILGNAPEKRHQAYPLKMWVRDSAR
jgi:hypothetical protein